MSALFTKVLVLACKIRDRLQCMRKQSYLEEASKMQVDHAIKDLDEMLRLINGPTKEEENE